MRPSGLAVRMSQNWTPSTDSCRSAWTIASPAGSLPCTSPTTSTFTGACSSPTRVARISRPSEECPMTSVEASAATSIAVLCTVSGVERVVIVGAGTFGASLAWHLAGRGDDVVLVDQFEPGDVRATSGGETRLIRCGHGTDADYTAMARRARTLWRELEAETGASLYTETGVSWFAHSDDGWEAKSEATMRALDIPVERQDVGAGVPLVRRGRPHLGAARARGRCAARPARGPDPRSAPRPPAARASSEAARRRTATGCASATRSWKPTASCGAAAAGSPSSSPASSTCA